MENAQVTRWVVEKEHGALGWTDWASFGKMDAALQLLKKIKGMPEQTGKFRLIRITKQVVEA